MCNLGLGLVRDAPSRLDMLLLRWRGTGVSRRGRATEVASRPSCKMSAEAVKKHTLSCCNLHETD